MQKVTTIDKLFYEQLGKELRAIRQCREMTLREVSQATGFSRTLIDCWELGFNKIKSRQFEILCEALQIDPTIYIKVELGKFTQKEHYYN